MPDEARDGRNVAFELSSDLLVCSIVQRNHSTINSACLITSITVPLRLAGDASACVIGAVLSHILPDESEHPVAFSSHACFVSNYSQVEKEAHSLIFGVHKFHQYLYS